MKVEIERDAEAEMVEAARYYDEHQPGLGSDFLDKVDDAIGQIAGHSSRFGFYRGSKAVRSVRLARFPYRLLFTIRTDRVLVVAVAHLHRHPDYWKNRLS